MKFSPCFTTLLLASAPMAGAALTNYWPLNESSGTTAVSTVPTGTTANLFPGADWVTDATRGQVLGFDGIDGYATAGTLPVLELNTNYTWSFWARSAMTANNNIMIGNRFPNEGWVKFTTAAFEFRDITPTFNETIDYPDFAVDAWVHHAVVKNGQLFTYYRNGVATGNTWNTGVLPANTPFYFGGDTTNENWGGRLDDVATWDNALPPTVIAGLFGAKYTPAAAPLTDTPPALTNVLADDFSGDLSNWDVTTRGLENTADGGYDFPATANGEVALGGTANSQYWYGRSLETLAAFDTRVYSEVNVKRTALTGTGTAHRASVWIFGDAGHYLHISQNVGENGWSFNARDDGGSGTLGPTGGGTNLDGLDPIDTDPGAHQLKFRILPTGISGGVNIEVQVDGLPQVIRGFTNFPNTFKVILTGQARAIGDTVNAVFDDVTVAQPTIVNEAPVFTAGSYFFPTAAIGTAYTQDLSGLASDPENSPLTFTKVSGPTWANISSTGTLSGTPDASTPAANLLVRVTDNAGGEATATVLFRVNNPATPTPPLFGWWPLNDASGDFGADISGGGNRANITNSTTGGLSPDGSVWFSDVDFGNVISFNGNDGAGAGWAVVGSPPVSGSLPVLDLPSSFTWSFWAKPTAGANNDIILGNRYNPVGGEYGTPQFTKFTGSAFEWYRGGTAQHIDYPDLDPEVWAHHVVVKEGSNIFYYRNGALIDGRAITVAMNEALPLYFGGGAGGGEAWSGYLHDVRLFNGALNENAVTTVYNNRGVFAAVSPTFTTSLNYQSGVPAGTPLSRSIASQATDPQGDVLTFSLVSGPAWLTVSANGTLGGTPDTSSPVANAVIRVQDPSGNPATATFIFRVEDPAATTPGAFGAWPLNDGTGTTALDVSGNNNNAEVSNVDFGGLGDSGSAWLTDAERGTVLSFEGTEGTSAFATVGAPPSTGTLPIMDLTNGFTWAFWAKPDQTDNNDIILGNRFSAAGTEFVPSQFIKFTSRAFEWNVNGAGQGIDYPDLVPGVWAHHAVVKQGNALFYYRNGVLTGSSTIATVPNEALPVYFGGGANALEAWRGALSDVRIFNGTLSEAALAALATPPSNNPGGLAISSISVAPNRAVTLQWNGEAGKTYIVYVSKTTSGFTPIGEVAANTFTFQPGDPVFNTAVETRLFFRVAEKIVAP